MLTGVAGAASAAAYRRLPRGRLHGAGRPKGGAGSGAAGRMRSRLGSLAAERDILGKAISRVHGDAGLGGRRRDALLAMYQRQLSAVLAKIDRLEEASRYPDLGPVGDALSEMMDQKLSSLDERLHELSARIAAAVPAAGAGAGAGAASQGPAAGKRGGKRAAAAAAAAQKQAALDSAQRRAAEAEAAEAAVPQQEQRRAQVQARAQPQPMQRRREEEAAREGPLAAAAEAEAAPAEGRHAVKPVEITTLTTIGGGRKTFPEVGRPRDAAAPAAGARPSAPEAPGQAKKGPGAAAAAAGASAPAAAAAASAAAAPAATGATPRPGPQGAAPPSLPASLPKPRPSGIPDAELEDADAGANAAGGRAADDDDLAAIVADIRSTLSKLEQAEVE